MDIIKKYIFFTPRICNIGGAENYINSKKLWLERNGWRTDVIFYDDGEVLLNGLKNCKHYVKELEYYPHCFSIQKQKEIVNNICRCIGNEHKQSIIIESSILVMAIWAEKVASKLGAKNFYYDLQETHSLNNSSIIPFIKFKFRRHELAGIGTNSIHEIMAQCGVDVPIGNTYRLNANNKRPIEEYDHPFVHEVENSYHDYIIGSIGRLEKPFVLPNIIAVINYVKSDSAHRYLLLLIGDCAANNSNRKEIEARCSSVSNLDLMITGYLYPIPIKLIRQCDMCFSSAGSAMVSKICGVPTISIDSYDLHAIGVLGYTTNNVLYRKDEPILPLKTYLDDILKERKYPKTEPEQQEEVSYESHFEYIDKSNQSKDYFDTSSISFPRNYYLHRLFIPLIGPERFYRVFSKIKGLCKR